MDNVRFENSEKNIPIPTKEVYQKMLINATETLKLLMSDVSHETISLVNLQFKPNSYTNNKHFEHIKTSDNHHWGKTRELD